MGSGCRYKRGETREREVRGGGGGDGVGSVCKEELLSPLARPHGRVAIVLTLDLLDFIL